MTHSWCWCSDAALQSTSMMLLLEVCSLKTSFFFRWTKNREIYAPLKANAAIEVIHSVLKWRKMSAITPSIWRSQDVLRIIEWVMPTASWTLLPITLTGTIAIYIHATDRLDRHTRTPVYVDMYIWAYCYVWVFVVMLCKPLIYCVVRDGILDSHSV